MVIAALITFGILLVAWAVAPERRQSQAAEVSVELEALRLAA